MYLHLPFFIGYAMMLAVANLVYIIFGVISAVKASKGRMYYYWIFGRIAHEKIFAVCQEIVSEKITNEPPKI
jgi:uncharacterized membrane protein